jgi:hypothetical protein
MNEAVALLLAHSDEDEPRFERARHLGPILARSVLARAGRLLVISDAVTALPMALLGAQARVGQNLEVAERRRPRVVLVYRDGVGPELEVALLRRVTDDHDRPASGLLDQLVAFEAVEVRATEDLARDTRELLEREAAQAVFVVGDYGPLAPAVRAAADYARRSRVPLYAVEAAGAMLDGWSPVHPAGLSPEEWSPTVGGHPIEDGEDVAIARAAYHEAALAIRLEELLDELIRS